MYFFQLQCRLTFANRVICLDVEMSLKFVGIFKQGEVGLIFVFRFSLFVFRKRKTKIEKRNTKTEKRETKIKRTSPCCIIVKFGTHFSDAADTNQTFI